MTFITAARLQQQFGLSFTAAERLIHEQTALARQHYRTWYALVWVALALMLLGDFLETASTRWISRTIDALLFVSIGILHWQTLRTARPRMLAAARAMRDNASPVA
jgi:hypothetical protein